MSDAPKTLSGIEAIRKRPGMYVGDMDSGDGLHQLLWEVISNCGDQIAAGRCDHVQIDIMPDHSMRVADNGPGWADIEIHGQPLLTKAVTTLHMSASLTGHAPHDHISLFSVGIVAVVALSEWCRIHTVRDGIARTIATRHGVVTEPETRAPDAGPSGTVVEFLPDRQIFPDGVTWDSGQLQSRLRELSVLLVGATFQFRDHRTHTYAARQPLGSLLQCDALGRNARLLSGEVSLDDPACLISWTLSYHRYQLTPHRLGFVNWAQVRDGPHVGALKQALRSVLRSKFDADTASQLQRGIAWVCRIQMQEPTYAGPTRDVLTHPSLQRQLRPLLRRAIAAAIDARPDWAT